MLSCRGLTDLINLLGYCIEIGTKMQTCPTNIQQEFGNLVQVSLEISMTLAYIMNIKQPSCQVLICQARPLEEGMVKFQPVKKHLNPDI